VLLPEAGLPPRFGHLRKTRSWCACRALLFITTFRPLPVAGQGVLFFGVPLYLLNRFILRVGSMVQGGNFVLRRDALIAAGGFDTSITFYGEDTDVARRNEQARRRALDLQASGVHVGPPHQRQRGLSRPAALHANYFWVTFFGRPFSRQHKDIRTE